MEEIAGPAPSAGPVRHRFWAVVASAWTCLIVVACLLPHSRIPAPESVSPLLALPQLDKVVHAALFIGFAALWTAALPPRRRTARIVLLGAAVISLTELGQSIPALGRVSDPYDVLADVTGLLIGLALPDWAAGRP